MRFEVLEPCLLLPGIQKLQLTFVDAPKVWFWIVSYIFAKQWKNDADALQKQILNKMNFQEICNTINFFSDPLLNGIKQPRNFVLKSE